LDILTLLSQFPNLAILRTLPQRERRHPSPCGERPLLSCFGQALNPACEGSQHCLD
jgi:hypothetical protein